jgi:hypothetical protein
LAITCASKVRYFGTGRLRGGLSFAFLQIVCLFEALPVTTGAAH